MILINSSPRNALRIFQPFLPVFVPVGVGYLAAAAERKAIPVRIIDEQIDDSVFDLITEHIKTMRAPYLFGFSVLTGGFGSALRVSAELKKIYPRSVICFGGIHPTAAPEEVLSHPHVDVVLRGEGEKSLVELYSCVKEGKDFRHIGGLSYRRDDKIIHNERSLGADDLESFPFPYHLFDDRKYDLGFIVSSRGCPHQCIFCSNRITTGKKYRVRSAETIVEELDMLYRKYEKRHVLFLDDNLLVSRQRIYPLLQMIRQKGLDRKMTFGFQARGDNVDYALLQEMYGAGFRSVFFGLETASERIMKVIKKGETVARCIEAVRMAKQIGFHVSATFIYALPGETHQDRMDCVSLCRELKLDMVRFNNATPYPGTELYEIAREENRLNIQGFYENFVSVSTFIENPFKQIPFSYVPSRNTEEEIRRDILYSYFSHYLDFSRLKNIFVRPDQGVGWFNAGERLVEVLKKIPSLLSLALMLFVKLLQLFYYSVLRKETAISLTFFLKVFEGFWHKTTGKERI